MLREYFERNFNKASYEMIDGGKLFYGEIRELSGVWATGKTLEECRRNLAEVLDGWMILRLKKNLPLPGSRVLSRKPVSVSSKVYA